MEPISNTNTIRYRMIFAKKKIFKIFLIYLLTVPYKIFALVYLRHIVNLEVLTWSLFVLFKMIGIFLTFFGEFIDIRIDSHEVLYFDFAVAAFKKNSDYIKNNWRMNFFYISKVSLVNLSNEEKINLGLIKSTGSKYLKIELKNEKVKYFYVQNFTNQQIDFVINKLNNEPRCQLPKISSYILYKIFMWIVFLF